MITVSIVEDDKEVREGLALLIDGTEGFSCIAAFGDCETAIVEIVADPPDVVLMDLGLPGMSGIEGSRRLKERLPELDVLVLTVHGETNLVFDALCAGACGYLLKSTPPTRILQAIEQTHRGGAPMSDQIARMVVNSFHAHFQASLTQREKEVLTLLCQGKSYKMIAGALFISDDTVRYHIKNVYKKLQVGSKSEAVAKALKEKLVAP
jgi:DNA-binding NarL/FixJ family response regulator